MRSAGRLPTSRLRVVLPQRERGRRCRPGFPEGKHVREARGHLHHNQGMEPLTRARGREVVSRELPAQFRA